LVVCRARRLHGIFVIVPVQPAHRLRISAMRNDEGAGRIDSGIYAVRRKRLTDRRCLRTQNAVCTRRKRSDALLFPFRLCIYVDEKFAYGLYFLRAQLRIGDECGFSRIAVDLRLDLCDRRAPSAEVHDAVGGRTGRAHALHQRRPIGNDERVGSTFRQDGDRRSGGGLVRYIEGRDRISERGKTEIRFFVADR